MLSGQTTSLVESRHSFHLFFSDEKKLTGSSHSCFSSPLSWHDFRLLSMVDASAERNSKGEPSLARTSSSDNARWQILVRFRLIAVTFVYTRRFIYLASSKIRQFVESLNFDVIFRAESWFLVLISLFRFFFTFYVNNVENIELN